MTGIAVFAVAAVAAVAKRKVSAGRHMCLVGYRYTRHL